MTQHMAIAIAACRNTGIDGQIARTSQPEKAVKTAGIQKATLIQYIQPSMTPQNSPKALWTQETIPPSSG